MGLVGRVTFGVLVCAAAAAPSAARADGDDARPGATFDAIAADATWVDRGGLPGLLWAVAGACDDGDDLARRQCRVVRDARVRRLAGRALIVPGDAGAVVVGAWDDKKKSAALTVTGCVACVEPVALGAGRYYIVSKKAAPTFHGGVARGATVVETARTFRTEQELTRWRTDVLPRLRTELVIRIDVDGAAWQHGDKRGVSVTVLGARVADPCSGDVIAASPKATRAPVDRAACGDDDADADPHAAKRAADVPDELSSAMIKAAMKPVRAAADVCFGRYGKTGDAKLQVTVAADGSVIAIEQTGDFVGSATGACIEEAARAARFPRTRKAKHSFRYPISLR
jgi:hypothetical protein